MFFRFPLFFFLLIPAFLAIAVFLRSEKRAAIFMRGISFGGRTTWFLRIQHGVFVVLLFLCSVLFLVILASPQHIQTVALLPAKTRDITLVVDLSYSMLAEDIAPNRIESAKKLLHALVEKAPEDVRFALVVFAAHPFLASPLTLDHNRFLDVVDYISVNMIDQTRPWFAGTALGDALLDSISLFPKQDPTVLSRSVIFLTDGAANIGTLDPRLVIDYAKQKWVRVLTIGIGDPKGTELYTTDQTGKRQYFLDGKGNPIRADLDEKLLTDIAQATQWIYVNIRSLNDVTRAPDVLRNALAFGGQGSQSLLSQSVLLPEYWSWLVGLYLTMCMLFFFRFRLAYLRS